MFLNLGIYERRGDDVRAAALLQCQDFMMSVDQPDDGEAVADLSVILANPYLRSVLDELFYLDAWKSGLVSPISAAIRVRQIRNAHLVPEKA